MKNTLYIMVALKSEESRINAQIVRLTHAYELVLFVYCFATEITAPKFIFFILQNLFSVRYRLSLQKMLYTVFVEWNGSKK